MSDDKNELSDEEYDALLRDLEGRAGGGGSSGGGGGASDEEMEVEDIDAFLSSLESQEDSKADKKSKKTATADRDDSLAAEFAALEEKGELTAPPEKKKKSKKKKSKKKKNDKKSKKEAKSGSDEEGQERSKGKRAALFALKTVFWFAPAIALWWVLGAYLGQWVSAAWLVAVMGAMFVFGIPAILKKLTKRGEYRPWVFGYSLVLTVALIAPMPNTAGEALTEYGHWPASVVAELSGAADDAGFVRAQASAAGWLGGVIATADQPQWEARQLGTVFPLGFQWSPEELAPLLEEGVDIDALLEEAGQDAEGSEVQVDEGEVGE